MCDPIWDTTLEQALIIAISPFYAVSQPNYLGEALTMLALLSA